jgi:hypothetical protein
LPPLLLAGLTLALLAALSGLTLLLLLLALLALVAFALYALRLIGSLFLIHKSLSNPGDQLLRCLGFNSGMRTHPAPALVLEPPISAKDFQAPQTSRSARSLFLPNDRLLKETRFARRFVMDGELLLHPPLLKSVMIQSANA